MTPVPRRANTPEQKRTLLAELLTLWLENPASRLGQLLVNGCDIDDPDLFGNRLFYLEDLDLMDGLNRSEHLKHPREIPSMFNPEWHKMGDGTRVPLGRRCFGWDMDYNRTVFVSWDGTDWTDKYDQARNISHWTLIPMPKPPEGHW